MACSGRFRARSQRDTSCLERGRQSMRGPGAVRFHAALGAAHGSGGFGYVQLLPVTHDESLALTRGQLRQLLLNYFKDLSLFELRLRRALRIRPIGGLKGFKRILVILAASRPERGEQRGPERAHLLAPEPVADGVLHDAVEKQRQL